MGRSHRNRQRSQVFSSLPPPSASLPPRPPPPGPYFPIQVHPSAYEQQGGITPNMIMNTNTNWNLVPRQFPRASLDASWRRRDLPSVHVQDMDRSARHISRESSIPFLDLSTTPPPSGIPTMQAYNNVHLTSPGTGFVGYPIQPLAEQPDPLPHQHATGFNPESQGRLFLEQYRYAGQQQHYEPPHYESTFDETKKRDKKSKIDAVRKWVWDDEPRDKPSQLRGDAPEFVPKHKAMQNEGQKNKDNGSQFSWTIVSSSSATGSGHYHSG